MAETNEIERVKEALRRLMEIKGIKAKPLSKQAGLGETYVRDFLERESGELKLGNVRKLATALEVTIEDLVGGASVPLVGRVGAGGSMIFEEINDGLLPKPPGYVGALEAAEIQGNSMLPRYSSGDVVYFAKERPTVSEADVGDFCVVRLATGETYVKQLARGSRPGFWTLRSLNADDIEDVELSWAAPVIFVLSRAARRRMGL